MGWIGINGLEKGLIISNYPKCNNKREMKEVNLLMTYYIPST
jgi:hypothetical protein